MFIRKAALLAAMALVGLFALGGTASATTVVTEGGGTLGSGGTIMAGASDPATLTVTGLGTITCNTTTFDATLGGTTGDVISGTLSLLTFENCTDTIPVINITGCTIHGDATLDITGTGASSGTVGVTDVTEFCAVSGSTSGCYYTAANAVGTATNSSLAYSNIAVQHVATTSNDLGSLCGSGASFTVTLTHLTAANGTTVTVTNNP
jgi:hypothetical protein